MSTWIALVRSNASTFGEVDMTLLGRAAVAMWWRVDAAQRTEFGDWHTHEHMPERMGIAGFRRGSRWASTDAADGFFVLYELDDHAILTSKGYLDRLNAPTPWSTKMMPHHRSMVRSQCRVEASFGGGIGTAMATIRLSPTAGREAGLVATLTALLRGLSNEAGLSGAHLLRTDTPTVIEPTLEQRMRGADRSADWIVLIAGYEPDAVRAVVTGRLSASALEAAGAAATPIIDMHALAFALTPQDVAHAV